MSTEEPLRGAPVGMLALAGELKNISAACERAGISRNHFYEIKNAFEKYGPESLAPAARRRARRPDQTLPKIERRILEMTARSPNYSGRRFTVQRKSVGAGVSASAVRGVLLRHGLILKIQRSRGG
jgi:transposase